jgi:hypothetical protein
LIFAQFQVEDIRVTLLTESPVPGTAENPFLDGSGKFYLSGGAGN